jgi:hypothetical protein
MLSSPVYTYLQKKRKGFTRLVQPTYAKVREHGAPVQGARLRGEARDLSHYQRTTCAYAPKLAKKSGGLYQRLSLINVCDGILFPLNRSC